MNRLIGYLGSCPTPGCGWVEGYFCVRCRHYVSDCRCGDQGGGCACGDSAFWAGKGERRAAQQRLLAAQSLSEALLCGGTR